MLRSQPQGSTLGEEMLMGKMGFKSNRLESTSTLYSPEQKWDTGEKSAIIFFACIKQLETSPLRFQANAHV